jgi:hypothetical protein
VTEEKQSYSETRIKTGYGLPFASPASIKENDSTLKKKKKDYTIHKTITNFKYKKLQEHQERDEKLKQVAQVLLEEKQDEGNYTFRSEAFTVNAVILLGQTTVS